MLALVLFLACGDPYQDLKDQETPWYTASGIEQTAGVQLAPMPAGQPLGELTSRLVVTPTGMHIDNRAWFLRLDHDEVIALRGHGRDRNLIYDAPVDIELVDGHVPESELKSGFIKQLDRFLARMNNTRKRLPSHLSPDANLQVYIDARVPLDTVRYVTTTAQRGDFDTVTLVGSVDGIPRAAVVERPEPWVASPCLTDVQVTPHDGGWLLTTVGAPAIAGPKGCTHQPDTIEPTLRALSAACHERWPRWQEQFLQQHPQAPIQAEAWQCLGARPRIEGDTPLAELMPLLGGGYAMYPDVVWGERRGMAPQIQLACKHATALDDMTPAQLDVLCGADGVRSRLALEADPKVDATLRRRILPGTGMASLEAFRSYNLDVSAQMMAERERVIRGQP